MFFLQNVGDFARHNDGEFRLLVYKICSYYDVSAEDVIQDLYLKFLEKKTLSTYDPNYPNAPKFSTYIYKVIHNTVKAKSMSREGYIERHQYVTETLDAENSDESDEFDYAFNHGHVNYEMERYSNTVSDEIGGIGLDLDLFELYLEKKDQVYKLNRRRDKSTNTGGMTLTYLFRLLRKGLSNKEIAGKFGVSVSFITSLNHEIMMLMEEFGIDWEKPDSKI